MKIETKKQEFQPVVITLETQEEVDQLCAISNVIGFKSDYDITLDLFDKLEEFSGGYVNYELELDSRTMVKI